MRKIRLQNARKHGVKYCFFRKGHLSFAEECGLENPEGVEDREGRIVGGHEAKRHEWPWQVRLVLCSLV